MEGRHRRRLSENWTLHFVVALGWLQPIAHWRPRKYARRESERIAGVLSARGMLADSQDRQHNTRMADEPSPTPEAPAKTPVRDMQHRMLVVIRESECSPPPIVCCPAFMATPTWATVGVAGRGIPLRNSWIYMKHFCSRCKQSDSSIPLPKALAHKSPTLAIRPGSAAGPPGGAG